MRKDSDDPDWFRRPPAAGSCRSVFKWGAADRFHPPKPGLLSHILNQLEIRDSGALVPRHTGEHAVQAVPSRLSRAVVKRFASIVGADNVEEDDFARVRYAYGQSAEEILQLRKGPPSVCADIVLHPRHKQDVSDIVSYCHEQRIPITVVGGGSSVTLGVRPEYGGVSLVMTTHMNRVLSFNELNRTVTVEPGMLGPAYENYLRGAPRLFNAGQSYTGGHFPQSFEHSTVGGWIATLGSGQQSSYYGDIYDLVVALEMVTPVGIIATADYPATATGPKVADILKGSEGAFGVVTAATLKVFPHRPENSRRFAYLMPDWPAAVQAARDIAQGQFGMPSMLRISDAEETQAALHAYGMDMPLLDRFLRLRGLSPMKRCLLLGQADGEKHFAVNLARRSSRICRRLGGLWLSGYPVTRWSHGRFSDPYMRDDLFDVGILIDTLETSVTWDRLHKVHAGVRSFIKGRPHTMCLTHASHFYPQGTNLYFIFIMPMTGREEYRSFQNGIIERILENGGSLSHHHGAGKMLGSRMQAHLGAEQMAVLRALKRHFDPHNIMNPGGTLGLDGQETDDKL